MRWESESEKNVESTLYDDVLGSNKIAIITKYCSSCQYTYYPGYFESFSDHFRQYYDGWDSYGIFVSTNCSSLNIDLLDRLICLKQKGHTTFIGKASAYNLHHMYRNSKDVLDKRRLSNAYFKYTYILFRTRHNLPLNINNGIEETLKMEFPCMYEKFQEKYGTHACDKPGCADCLSGVG